MSYFVTNRYRVVVCWAILAGLSPVLAQASEPTLSQRCRNFFSAILSPAPKRQPLADTADATTPPRRASVLVSGARGATERKLRADLDQMNVLLGGFQHPPGTTIHFEETDRLGHFAYDDLDIHLPRWMSGKVSHSDVRLRRAVVQHEYGHAVFTANFGEYSSEWKAWYNSANRLGLGPRRHIRTPKPGELIHLSSPYQELFADLLTVVSQGDPEAMAESLSKAVIFGKSKDGKLTAAQPSRQSVSPRSFAAGTDPDWRKSEIDPHHLFAPARRHLWKNYFTKERPFQETGIMLRKVFNALATEIMARYDTPALRNLEPQDLNARVIRALDEALVEYKLK